MSFMLSVANANKPIMFNVVMVNVIMQNVVAPFIALHLITHLKENCQ